MGEQPVIDSLLPDAADSIPSKEVIRRVLCGGLFGMRGGAKSGTFYSDAAAASVPPAEAKAKEDHAQLS